LLTVAEVKEANSEPFNLREAESRPYNLGYKANDYIFDLGTVQFSGPLLADGSAVDPIRIDGSSVMGARVQDGQLLMSMVFCDDSGSEVFRVKENELRYNKAMWDVEFVGKRLKIREKARRIVLDIEFEPPNRILVKRGRILRNGIDILVTEKWTAVLNGCQLFQQVQFKNCDVGIRIGKDPRRGGAAIEIDPGPRTGWDRAASVKWAIDLSENLLVPEDERSAWLEETAE
jgi:trigger factor